MFTTVRDTVSTGVPALDRKLDGGLPTGTVVSLLADPASQSELFLSELASQRETLYLTVDRSPTAVSKSLNGQAGAFDDLSVKSLDASAPVVDALRSIATLPEDGLVVIDPIGPLERAGSGSYRAFLSELKSIAAQRDAVAVLHALKHADAPSQRHRTEHVADVVFDLVTEPSGDSVENRLLVPKFRGGRALTDAVRMSLTDRIAVDTSRDIA